MARTSVHFGDAARHRLVVRCLVVGRAGGGETDGAGAHRLLDDSAHAGKVVVARRLGECPFSHDVGAQGGVPDVTGVVDPLGQGLEHIQVLGVAFPAPADAGQHGLAGDVFGPFQVAKHQVGLGFPARGQGEATVAHDDAGDAVVAGTRADGVPEHLGVHVGMAVDESGGDDVAVGVDVVGSLLGDPADAGDPAVDDAQVRRKCGRARAIDDGTIPYD